MPDETKINEGRPDENAGEDRQNKATTERVDEQNKTTTERVEKQSIGGKDIGTPDKPW